jgi:nucleotidyltransferase AbiEii toxin of type IV toxin-antitoxin system
VPEDLAQVRAACLTVAVALGAPRLDDICIVGGLVPSLLIDQVLGPEPGTGAGHPGTTDLDIGLKIALLDDKAYAEVSQRLRQEGFGPDRNRKGNPTPQRWKMPDFNVTIDFLIAPLENGPDVARVQPLEGDFGALIIPGIELTASERVMVEIDDYTLKGERAKRTVPVCGPGAFVVLKALAFNHRGEPKDAFDLVYVIRRWPDGKVDIAQRLAEHSEHHGALVHQALEALRDDFRDPEHLGPIRAAEFDTLRREDLDAAIADAHGHVDDLLRRCDELGRVDVH